MCSLTLYLNHMQQKIGVSVCLCLILDLCVSMWEFVLGVVKNRVWSRTLRASHVDIMRHNISEEGDTCCTFPACEWLEALLLETENTQDWGLQVHVWGQGAQMPVSVSMVSSNKWGLKDRIEKMCTLLHWISIKLETLTYCRYEQRKC